MYHQGFTHSDPNNYAAMSAAPTSMQFNANTFRPVNSFPTLVQTPVTPDGDENFEFLADDFSNMQFGNMSQQQGMYTNQQPHHQQQRRGGYPNMGHGRNNNICKFFAAGNCTKGQNCKWLHAIPTIGSRYGQQPRRRQQQNRRVYGQRQDMQYHHQEDMDQQRQQKEYAYATTAAQVQGKILKLSRQQQGCRLLQKLLEIDEPGRALILEEVFSSLNTLVIDPFGHHLVLRLLDTVNYTDRKRILDQLYEDLVAVSLNVHGTRIVQKLLECMENADEFEVIEKAFVFVITLAKDVYGMHVVLRCLHRIPAPSDEGPPDNSFIFREITKNIVSVATHKHGCCVVQWCIDYANVEQRKALVNVIVANALELAQDAFGNYVLQQIMDTAQAETLDALVKRLKGSMSKLAVQKFSSIVVEKCIEMAPKERRREIYSEIINPAKLSRLLQDPYANYVIQKILQITRQEEFHEIVELIQPHLNNLGTTPFGKRIKTQMIRKFPILSMGQRRQKPLNDSTSTSM